MTDELKCTKCGSLDIYYLGPQFTKRCRLKKGEEKMLGLLELYNCGKCRTTIAGDSYNILIKRLD